MPKCELKPWKLNEKQPVFISDDGENRISVKFIHSLFKGSRPVRVVSCEYIDKDGNWECCGLVLNYVYEKQGFMERVWIDEFLGLLGIPETIEVENG
jgi:hypothetical protein